ncbi:MAG TPA: peroxiredoxin [Alcanivoracaceae bacterium]|nr:peroxiredoxin [Alcanivoracaceae bacterium]
MNVTRTLFAMLLMLSLSLSFSAHALDVGDLAPDFDLPSSEGVNYRLSDFRGKQVVVLAWFPKALTYGCTQECQSLAYNGDKIREFDVSYFMISVDPLRKNIEFAEKVGADFPLLSDESKEVAKAYEVLNFFGLAKRYTFYIGKDGKILAIDRHINPSTSAEDMMAKLEQLNVERVATDSQ